MNYCELITPLGNGILAANDQGLSGFWFVGQRHFKGIEPRWINAENSILQTAKTQLSEYFSGKRTTFDLPLAPQGTEFQMKVWEQLLAIDYGETSTYGTIAQQLNQPQAVRAVGAAVGKNPLTIIIPCHRVLGSTQQLTGYAGGLDRKQWLLSLEQSQFNQQYALI